MQDMLSLSIYIPLWYDSNGKSTFLAILGKELYIPPLCQVLDTYFLLEIAYMRSRFLISLTLQLFIVKFLNFETYTSIVHKVF